MKNLNELNAYRIASKWLFEQLGSFGDEWNGTFLVPFPRTSTELRCIASNGGGWDHVSVSLKHRVPNWYEMEHVRKTFFLPGEIVMQLHLPDDAHINVHPNCLHLWRPHDIAIPLPPRDYV